jgi:hypothetical protein
MFLVFVIETHSWLVDGDNTLVRPVWDAFPFSSKKD